MCVRCGADIVPATMPHIIALTNREWLEMLGNLDADGQPIPFRPQPVPFIYGVPRLPVFIYGSADLA